MIKTVLAKNSDIARQIFFTYKTERTRSSLQVKNTFAKC